MQLQKEKDGILRIILQNMQIAEQLFSKVIFKKGKFGRFNLTLHIRFTVMYFCKLPFTWYNQNRPP